MNKLLQAEVEDIVACYDQEVSTLVQLVNSKFDITDSTKAGLVGGSVIIHNGYLLRLSFRPVLKVVGKLMVADNYVFIHESGTIYIVKEPVKNVLVTNLQKWLREILCKGI